MLKIESSGKTVGSIFVKMENSTDCCREVGVIIFKNAQKHACDFFAIGHIDEKYKKVILFECSENDKIVL